MGDPYSIRGSGFSEKSKKNQGGGDDATEDIYEEAGCGVAQQVYEVVMVKNEPPIKNKNVGDQKPRFMPCKKKTNGNQERKKKHLSQWNGKLLVGQKFGQVGNKIH